MQTCASSMLTFSGTVDYLWNKIEGGPNNYVENPWTDGSKDAIINNTDIFRYI